MLADDELLELLREHDPPQVVLPCLVAARVIAAKGDEVTVRALGRETGYGKTQLYAARNWLDANVEGWRDAVGFVTPAPVLSAPTPAQQARLELELPPERVPVWRRAVAERLPFVAGLRSWDLYRDIYAEAADRVIYEVAPEAVIGELTALAANFVGTLTGAERLDDKDRALVALLVRRHGKAALYGLNEALGRTGELSVRDAYRYALRVCEAAVAGRQNGAGA